MLSECLTPRFAPAFSLAPSLAFLNNVIEIRTAGLRGRGRYTHSNTALCNP